MNDKPEFDPHWDNSKYGWIELKWGYREATIEPLRELCAKYDSFPVDFIERAYDYKKTHENVRRAAERNGLICAIRSSGSHSRVTRIIVTPFGQAWARDV